jgi:hypothetical protein
MAELGRVIDDLQRQFLALGGDAYALPAQVILGCRSREAVKVKLQRRMSEARA